MNDAVRWILGMSILWCALAVVAALWSHSLRSIQDISGIVIFGVLGAILGFFFFLDEGLDEFSIYASIVMVVPMAWGLLALAGVLPDLTENGQGINITRIGEASIAFMLVWVFGIIFVVGGIATLVSSLLHPSTSHGSHGVRDESRSEMSPGRSFEPAYEQPAYEPWRDAPIGYDGIYRQPTSFQDYVDQRREYERERERER